MFSMDFLTLVYSILIFIMVVSSINMILATNPVHSILFLILIFCCAICIFISIGIDFLALVFLIVYVGAIAVLFLFVVMMLNMKIIELEESFFRYLPIGFLSLIIIYFEIKYLISLDLLSNMDYKAFLSTELSYNSEIDLKKKSSFDLYLIGVILYSDFFFYFIISSFILLVAMVGAIALTLNYVVIVKRQDIYKQVKQSILRSIKYR